MSEGQSEQTTHKHLTIPLIGLQVERRTDLLAAAAFVMALIAAISQIYHSWLGPRVSVFAPEQLAIIIDTYPNGEKYLRIGARMAYVNAARAGYNATVRLENVEFVLAGQNYTQAWHSVVHFDYAGSMFTPKFIHEARPFPVNAGSSTSQEVYFAPRQERCADAEADCDSSLQFLDGTMAIAAINEISSLEFTFGSWIFGQDEPMKISCVVDIDQTLVDGLVLNGWAAPACWPNS